MAFQVDLRPKQLRPGARHNDPPAMFRCWLVDHDDYCGVLLIVSGGYHGGYLSVGVILPKANVSRNSSYFSSFGSWAAFGMKLQLVEWAI